MGIKKSSKNFNKIVGFLAIAILGVSCWTFGFWRSRDKKQNTRSEKTQKLKQEKKDTKKYTELEKEQKIQNILKKIKKTIASLDILENTFSSMFPGPQDVISNWYNFKDNLAAMRQKLEKIKSTDPETDTYNYFQNIKTNNDIKNLEILEKLLHATAGIIEKNEPLIKISDEGTLQDKAAKENLKELVNTLTKTVPILSKTADYFIDRFEGKKGEAAKIRKKEEKIQKKAEFSLKRIKRRRGKVKEAGTPEDSGEYSSYDYDY